MYLQPHEVRLGQIDHAYRWLVVNLPTEGTGGSLDHPNTQLRCVVVWICQHLHFVRWS